MLEKNLECSSRAECDSDVREDRTDRPGDRSCAIERESDRLLS